MAERGSVLVIGGGSAGNAAARRLADAGFSVVVAEPAKLGGTCLWTGCVPKKSLYRSAQVLRCAREAEQFGVTPEDVGYDWQTVLAWKWHSQETYAGDQAGIARSHGIEVIDAPARFLSPTAVEVGGTVIEPDHLVVSSGSEPVILGIPGVELADLSDDALHYPGPPESLVIIGGGYVGMEFASTYAAFGSKVTVLTDGPRVLENSDPEIVEVVVRRMQSEGVEFVTGAKVDAIEGVPGRLEAVFSLGAERRSVSAARVLLAVGRKPALDALDLATGGVDVDDTGRPLLDDSFRSVSNPRVWVIGDARGSLMLTPLASYEGALVARSLISGDPQPPDRVVPSVVFTNPPIGQVGLTQEGAAAEGMDVDVRRQRFERMGAAIIDDERGGMVKLIFADEDGRLVGGHVVGPPAPELVYALALGVRMRSTTDDIAHVLGIHPAYCESVNWAAG